MEEMNTTRPSPVAFSMGAKARTVANWPRQLTANIWSIRASSSASRSAWGDGLGEAGGVDQDVQPAPAGGDRVAQGVDRGSVGDIRRQGGVATAGKGGGDCLAGGVLAGPMGDDHGGAGLGEQAGAGGADAAGAADDQGDLAVELHGDAHLMGGTGKHGFTGLHDEGVADRVPGRRHGRVGGRSFVALVVADQGGGDAEDHVRCPGARRRPRTVG